MTFDKLIGAQIMSVGSSFIVVKKDGILYTLELEADGGDCCGYGDFETHMYYEEDSERNPVITNVEYVDNDDNYGSSATLTFYGEDKALAEVDASAGSGSGWNYGATVTISCSGLEIDETLASW